MNVSKHKDMYYEFLYTNSKVLQALEEAFKLGLNRRNNKPGKFEK